MKAMREKVFITAVLVLCWALLPMVGYGGPPQCDGIAEQVGRHFAYMWCHGSVWHLVGNVFVVWVLRRPLYLIPAVVIGFLCSWIPAVPGLWEMIAAADAAGTVAEPVMTVGFSGVLFAIVGVKWGYCRYDIATYRTFVLKVVPIALLGFFIPHLNWSLHLYCLIAGLGYGLTATMWQHRETSGK